MLDDRISNLCDSSFVLLQSAVNDGALTIRLDTEHGRAKSAHREGIVASGRKKF